MIDRSDILSDQRMVLQILERNNLELWAEQSGNVYSKQLVSVGWKPLDVQIRWVHVVGQHRSEALHTRHLSDVQVVATKMQQKIWEVYLGIPQYQMHVTIQSTENIQWQKGMCIFYQRSSCQHVPAYKPVETGSLTHGSPKSVGESSPSKLP